MIDVANTQPSYHSGVSTNGHVSPWFHFHLPIIFKKKHGVYVLNDLLYNICDVYIDDMLILDSNDDNFISNAKNLCFVSMR